MTLEELNDQPAQVGIVCPRCDELHWVVVTTREVAAYTQGALLQDAFPNLTLDERRLLITGLCGPCFTAMFGGES